MPAKAGGAPIKAAPASTTCENFFASSTTANSDTSNSTALSMMIRFEACGPSCAAPPVSRDEIIPVPHGLRIEKHAVEQDGDGTDKAELPG